MSDKQLTVAELMARAAQEGRSTRESRPRRRRSLDEGGVSVAELTGSIPRVNKKPAEAKHSSVPLDAPEDDVATTFTAATAAAPVEDQRAAAPTHHAARDADTMSVDKPTDAVAPQKPIKRRPMPGDDANETATGRTPASAETESMVDSPVDRGTGAVSTSAPASAAANAGVASAREVSDLGETTDDETMVLSVVTEDDPVRLTTGAFPALAPELVGDEPIEETTTAEQRVAPTEKEGSDVEDEEIVTKVVFAEDDFGYQDDGYRDDDFGDEAISDAPADTAGVGSAEQEGPGVAFATGTFAQVGTGQFEQVDELDVEVELSEAEDAEDLVEAEEFSEELDTYDEDAEYDDDDEYEEEGEGKISVVSVILMVVIAIAVGVGLFKGFEMLWANLSNIVTGVLAVAVTGCIVGVVHALRTERDGLSMVLAGIAGLAVTFGPLLIVGL